MKFILLVGSVMAALVLAGYARAAESSSYIPPEAMVQPAFNLWRTVAPFDQPTVIIKSADAEPAYQQVHGYFAWTFGNGTPECTIWILHREFDEVPQGGDPLANPYQTTQQLIIDHEIGHCLGIIDHIPEDVAPDAIMSFNGGQHLTEADAIAFLRVHPLPARSFVVVTR